MDERNQLQFIRGIGPRRAEALAASGVVTVSDLLHYFPYRYVDRSSTRTVRDFYRSQTMSRLHNSNDESNGEVRISRAASIMGTVEKSSLRTTRRGASLLTVTMQDDEGELFTLTYFAQAGYFQKVFQEGLRFWVTGNPETGHNSSRLQFTHPEIERVDDEEYQDYSRGQILAVYTLTKEMKEVRITNRILRDAVKLILSEGLHAITETIPAEIAMRHHLLAAETAIRALHVPASSSELNRALQRMKFEELFLFQLYLALRHNGYRDTSEGVIINPKSASARKLLDSCGFALTRAQVRVVNEIAIDFGTGRPMTRLLQGDVGSGKTIVSLFAMLMAVDAGYQAAILAPTEVLAEQHYQGIRRYVEPLGIRVVQLVGGQRAKLRRSVREDIANGTANIIVGTHALFGGQQGRAEAGSELEYYKLAFIVIDEQHRFGVEQRAKIRAFATRSLNKSSSDPKKLAPHLLVMSATPIPRTLSMTLYGDLDVSVIDELPKNRKPIKTEIVFESGLGKAHDFIRNEIRVGRQAYIVYPLVEESEKVAAKSAVEHYEFLKSDVFPEYSLGLIHGQMQWYEKEEAMVAFRNGAYHILVATTVIEVGIDVPNASVMLIENAERFGLAQLHQLRGRVGRGAEQSYCFLATKDNFQYVVNRKKMDATERSAAITRLTTMRDTNDGFKISEVDMSLRGPGDILGTKQSGAPELRFTDLLNDTPIIEAARTEAFQLIAGDPHLRRQENIVLRDLFIARYGRGGAFIDIA